MIRSLEELRALYPPTKPRALQKQLSHLDQHCRRFIALSPFVVLASGDGAQHDASPRGGSPGFVKVVDDTTLLIPDSPGNNRLDSLSNIIASGRLGLLFLIPGIDESLRINGAAEVSVDEALLAQVKDERRTPRVVIRVTVEEAYLHCAKALMRSRLWADDSRHERSVLPSMGKMIQDQAGGSGEPESQAAMLARYRDEL
ncbi:pyridoxamine 5'-phosphate oxidase family protein [Halomonas salipaludis]|uniref:Phosphohydrolase n=1 Tax=Halomonas salipaludis TaxID=2032625 RepID=A0A2A2EPL3_9GAMM|nr:pyridoxamine 5'-phosphate oxidase family protein [Halomonas salipaludis]PAU74213.1 phosphohydrolase [Halomonas salipaludis]